MDCFEKLVNQSNITDFMINKTSRCNFRQKIKDALILTLNNKPSTRPLTPIFYQALILKVDRFEGYVIKQVDVIFFKEIFKEAFIIDI